MKRVEVVVRSYRDALGLPLQSYDSWMVMKENLDRKENMTVLSCTSFRVHTVGIWRITYRNLRKMGPSDTLDHGLGCLESTSKSSNPEFASNKVIKTIWGFRYESFMVFGVLGHFGKTAESNPKSATPTFYIKWVLNQVRYASFIVFGEFWKFIEIERDRLKYPKARLLRKYSKFFNSTFDLVAI